jgi:DNA-binding NtrC family response regulator
MRQGAADYLTKPFEKDELLLVLGRALKARRLEQQVESLRRTLRDRHRLGRLIGAAPPMQEVFALVERVAPTDVAVLIRGESGTGKELVARAIHELSGRAARPFVALNCAAVPEGLLESEFFGHERGAFTGAVQSRPGRLEQADGGTLFLDEIGAMRVDLQVKLLRAVQERVVERLGSKSSRAVDVRIVAATCEDLEDLVRRRAFRDDLYYRLAVVPVELPPLRDRREDVPLLVDHFLALACQRFGRPRPALAPELMERLLDHPWPGNVRELQNCVERVVVLAASPSLGLDDLPPAIRRGPEPAEVDTAFRLPLGGVRLAELERSLLRQALERSRGSLAPAARLLGISYKTLQYRIRKHGLGRHEPGAGGDEEAAED